MNQSGIPGMLNGLQTEWDTVVMETYELRKHLESVRKQLAHALYQHDAACRVISRLIKERDEARQALAMTQEKLADYKDRLGVQDTTGNQAESLNKPKEEDSTPIEQDNCGIYPELVEKMNEVSGELFTKRKEKTKPKDYYKPSDFNLLTEKGSYPLHSSTAPGILSLDIHRTQTNYICTGGNDGNGVIFDLNSKKVVCTLNNRQDEEKVSGVQFTQNGVLLTRSNGSVEYWNTDLLGNTCQLQRQIQGSPGVVASAHPLNPYFVHGVNHNSWGMFNMETGTKLCEVPLQHDSDLTCVTVHPDGLMMATGSSNGIINIWDIRSQSVVATLEGHTNPVTTLQFSEKAIHLASASTKENIPLLYKLKKLKSPPTKLVHSQGSVIKGVNFDPYGAYIASACDNKICFFETANPETTLFELEAHKEAINDVKFAMDGSYVASVSEDRFLKVFSL